VEDAADVAEDADSAVSEAAVSLLELAAEALVEAEFELEPHAAIVATIAPVNNRLTIFFFIVTLL
jgi:hypothetical protein